MNNLSGRAFQIFCRLCFIAYVLLLIKLIIFKFPDSMTELILNNWSFEGLIRHIQSANFIPFKTIGQALFSPQLRVELPTLIYNILAFIPLGVLVPCLKPAFNRVLVVLLAGLIVSTALEVIQTVTILGTGDIDDVILNVFGALVGYLIFRLVVVIYRRFYQSPPEVIQ